ncbi:toxin-antitoxin system YwqK family antitoxin [Vibrio fluminensis]|uniref:toxin-antitoxin system YwqK family antitoxin n=1 Tax=Vibrio fluminensis TaxID=2783614 RepID=UPI0018875C0C|nr:toxin-antitoxin system YwqK family antitoxin [Vibrio fluminensis]
MKRLFVRTLVLVCMLGAPMVYASPIWLDDDWNVVKSESQASYYLREPLVERNGLWPVSVYFQGGKILNFEGTFNSGDITTGKSVGAYKIYHANGNLLSEGSRNEKGQYEGLTRIYDQDGVLIEEADFLAGKRHGIHRTFYPNGQVKAEYTNKNNIAAGEYVSYYKNGQVSYRVNYVSGMQEGPGYSYSENGFLYLETTFRKGKKHGVVRGWYSEDQLRFEKNYREGKQHGAMTHYYESGNLQRINHLVKGKQIGSQRSYFDQIDAVQEKTEISKDGEVVSKYRFNKDGVKTYEYTASFTNKKRISDEKKYSGNVLISRIQENRLKKWKLEERFDKEGSLTRREEVVAGKRHNAFIQVDVFTNNLETTHYKQGTRHGSFSIVTPLGKTIQKGTYVNGKKSGTWTWHYDGIVRNENYNRKGELHGELSVFGANGEQMVSEHYLNGLQHGHTENYSDNGELLAKGNYIRGNRDGQWQHQEEYESDVRIWSGEYHNGKKVGKWFARSSAGYETGRQQFDEQGRKQGAFYYFGDSGNLKLIERYVDDVQHGNSDSYGTDGKIHYTETYKMGEFVMSEEKNGSTNFLLGGDS